MTDATRYELILFDLNVTRKPLRDGSYSRQRGHHLHVGITVLQIKTANQIAIGFDPIRIEVPPPPMKLSRFDLCVLMTSFSR